MDARRNTNYEISGDMCIYSPEIQQNRIIFTGDVETINRCYKSQAERLEEQREWSRLAYKKLKN